MPCGAEYPHLQKIQDEYKDKGVAVLMVSLDEDDYLVHIYAKRKPASAIILPAANQAKRLRDAYGVVGIPATLVIDRDGVVRYFNTGFRQGVEKTFRVWIDSLVKETGR